MNFNDGPTVTFKKLSNGWWVLYNSKGGEICEAKSFHTDNQAVDWAKAYISSWSDWRLEIDYGEKGQADSVSKKTN